MEKRQTLYKPIFIIGAARSGTTLLGEILSQHDDLAYWLEPKYIWRYGKPSAKNDIREAKEAIPKTANYIRKRFFDFLKERQKSRFIEKTPSNVFRVAFMHKIFPEALFVHILRNGNDVSLSAEKKWTQKPAGSAVKRRLLSNEIPWIDVPYYFKATLRDLIARFFLPKKGFIWGPQFRNMSLYRKEHGVIETCAMQWVESVKKATQDLDKIPTAQKHVIKYENLLQHPEKELSDLLQFLELQHNDVIEYAKKNVRKTKNKYSQEELEKLKIIQPIIEEAMTKTGYSKNLVYER